MKLFIKLFSIFAFLLVTTKVSAQNSSTQQIGKSISHYNNCGFNSSCLYTKNTLPIEKIKIPAHSISRTTTCGRFRFTFNDIVNNTGVGFDDVAQGNNYIQCVCGVANYFQLIFNTPNGDFTPIDIIFENSWTSSNPAPNPSILGKGGPIFSDANFNNNIPGFYGGNAFMHYTTGFDPDSLLADATITINFDHQYFNCGQLSDCDKYDFKTLILHELTHAMGWASCLNEDVSGNLVSGFNSNKFTMYDKHFLFYGDVTTGPFQQLVDTSTNNVNNFQPHFLLENKLWFYNILSHSFTQNQNISLSFVNAGDDITNTISHFVNNQDVFFRKSYKAPGFQPEFIMGLTIPPGFKNSTYTIQEIRALNYLGYQFTNNYFIINSNLINNHHPFTTKTITKEIWYLIPPFPATDMADNANGNTPADYVITNCDSVSIDLFNDSTIKDIDTGDVKRIYPSSLFNIRGCGINGNNHACLTLTSNSSSDVVKFKPRSNFIGRAQFGFNLYDGKERGAFMIYTIDVNSCTNQTGENIVNGNFEEGMEVCKMDTIRLIENSVIRNNKDLCYVGGFGMFPDGIKYLGWNGIAVKNSYGCDSINGTYGVWANSFASTGSSLPLASANGGERYFTHGQTYACFSLYNPMITCAKYKLEFDVCIIHDSSAQIKIGFTDAPQPFNGTITIINSSTLNLNLAPDQWVHKVMYIDFCDSSTARYLAIDKTNTNFATSLGYDNISLTLESTDCNYCITNINNNLQDNTDVGITNNNSNHELSIHFNNKKSNSEIKIYDSAGRIVLNTSAESNHKIISTMNFTRGVFLVEVRNNRFVSTKKVVVE